MSFSGTQNVSAALTPASKAESEPMPPFQKLTKLRYGNMTPIKEKIEKRLTLTWQEADLLYTFAEKALRESGCDKI